MKKTLKKITCGVLASVCVLGCTAGLTACETANPEVKMELSFNGESYTLNYKLYRKVAPETVEHFLYLVDNDYYDGLCVHDYAADTAMYTGGYTAGADNATQLTYKPYYETIAGFANYDKFPHSIWLDEGKNTPSYTLLGEFEAADFRVESGAIKESFGSLAMYYDDITNTEVANTNVYTSYKKKEKKGQMRSVDYKYNHTTSMFSISLVSTEQTNASYCTFATLSGKSKDVLTDLQEAISEYAGEEAFTETVSTKIFQDDPFMKDKNVKKNLSVPKAPIIIQSVKVTKY